MQDTLNFTNKDASTTHSTNIFKPNFIFKRRKSAVSVHLYSVKAGLNEPIKVLAGTAQII